ncbi:hypothetical protein A2641_03205 [Candidatus Nomurabacteria bacterium RIFCSPHIGHO2_01_FULL_37_25]|uniref:Uncharacterized protein n=1 Tax=Candidatus Nomurabacteria bacterium RIFCSPLOWO2_01_FULL_36_16 TaxID=1801767 RepID=A0A1F6X029_9BACT|nr:MAG: hypothetical protein A2641_03205 [Candidatus Nomurabacteria bacterium RIFCSPHIGHO2_01_FULL_37_25]OGI75497.1 MAG: hypothetical protein A3D36_02850 [Candidatus Nomurabacteria bacterium RIFCSPHIGHO2_02_FULL_36_29]OGI87335.1 MAG: hypothetical protein A3A91_02470 [Candidatus Nomurabacteria bacterium RIFCSPLOWO2_01_FULL_36_16]OGI94883.1 MAG: hypothetical protein A3I84_00530 [Candidatus Nomurabacteria bacterium RIFCSPLOWO2_02_FULL_36_8]
MQHYLYILYDGGNPRVVFFEGEKNVILARQRAEREYGEGGRLFVELEKEEQPPATDEEMMEEHY